MELSGLAVDNHFIRYSYFHVETEKQELYLQELAALTKRHLAFRKKWNCEYLYKMNIQQSMLQY